ncbi:MAG: hypothetical protein U1E42_08445 [Rhodospirillales bacterium]
MITYLGVTRKQIVKFAGINDPQFTSWIDYKIIVPFETSSDSDRRQIRVFHKREAIIARLIARLRNFNIQSSTLRAIAELFRNELIENKGKLGNQPRIIKVNPDKTVAWVRDGKEPAAVNLLIDIKKVFEK